MLAAAVLGAFGVITYGVNQYMDEVIEDNIRGMNRRSTIAMREKIDSRINTLSLLAEKAAGVDSAAKAREVLEPYVERYRLYKMIMIFPDGTQWVSDGTLRSPGTGTGCAAAWEPCIFQRQGPWRSCILRRTGFYTKRKERGRTDM